MHIARNEAVRSHPRKPVHEPLLKVLSQIQNSESAQINMSGTAAVTLDSIQRQYRTNAGSYNIVTVPNEGLEVYDVGTRDMLRLNQNNNTSMLRCLVWMAFCWGNYTVFQMNGGPSQVSGASLKQVAHSEGLGYTLNDLQGIMLRVNKLNLCSRTSQSGEQVLSIDVTVYFTVDKSYIPSLYILHLDLEQSATEFVLGWMRY